MPLLRRVGLTIRHRFLAEGHQELQAALRRIDELLKKDVLLREQVALLAQEVEKAHQFAYRDELTGLPNRRLLVDRFRQVVARDARRNSQVALLFLDIDGFKRLNDTFGHVVGDRLLVQVADRLTASIRVSDTACRYGGDEFVVLLPDFDGPVQAVAAAEQIRARLAAPYTVGSSATSIETSIGIAIYPTDGCELDDLIQASDRAMYRDKARTLVPPGAVELRSVKQALGLSSKKIGRSGGRAGR